MSSAVLESAKMTAFIVRKLSQAFFMGQSGDKVDLMNDWEIRGTQNKWVCPSDRHLQLRAQLKSGWSSRTGPAKSPTNAKTNPAGITEAEQAHIQAVIARAEAGRKCEQERVGKLVERLDNMRRRATGNGVTQCMLCSAEFGLLGSKSYGAMCHDCRKYVCQKNCGLETFDQKRSDLIFLCKICSENREVVGQLILLHATNSAPTPLLQMWKKSGAWFFKEMPEFMRPTDSGAESPNGGGGGGGGVGGAKTSITWTHQRGKRPTNQGDSSDEDEQLTGNGAATGRSNIRASSSAAGRQMNNSPATSSRRHTPGMTPEQIQMRSRSAPRPKIMPSWVRDNVAGSSMSICSEDEDSSSSEEAYKESGVAVNRRQNRPKDLTQKQSDNHSLISAGLQRIAVGTRRLTDSDSDGAPESHSPTPSTSPRPSLATPSSHGEDTASRNQSIVAGDISDTRSIDSGASDLVVQSDHSQTAARRSSVTMVPVGPTAIVRIKESAAVPPKSMSKPEIRQPDEPESVNEKSKLVATKSNESRNLSMTTARKASSSAAAPPAASSPEEESKNHLRPQQKSSFKWRRPMRVFSQRTPRPASTSTETPADADRPKSASFIRRSVSNPFRTPRASASMDFDFGSLGSLEFSLTYKPEENQLVVKLIRAKKLKAMDSNGFSDPYVKLHLIPGNAKATKLTSKTIEKTLNPEWNEQLIYYGVTEDDRMKKTLRLTVLDRDRIGSDFLGETRIALRKLVTGKERHFDMYLENATPVQKSEETTDCERGKILLSLCYNVQQGSLLVGIRRCVELVGLDSSGYSDPYVKLALTPPSSKSHRQKTAIKKKTLNPEFNEELSFPIPLKELPKKQLEVGVFDHDVGKQDDYIGGLVLSSTARPELLRHWIQCLQNPGQRFELWHHLTLDASTK